MVDRRWPKPKTPAEAVRRWGKSGTVSIDANKLGLEMRVLMTFEKKQIFRGKTRWDEETVDIAVDDPWWQGPHGVRFSGHPEALLAMFRALHIEYAKRRGKFRELPKVRKRTIILDVEGKESADGKAEEVEGRPRRNRR